MSTTKRSETFWHPRTGTRYEFPADARKYLALARRTDRECEHGHFGCAGWKKGPCSDAVEAWYTEDA